MNVVKSDPFNAFLDTPGPDVPAGSGILSGNTLAVKDIYDVAGYPTGCGNPQWLAQTAPAVRTAPSVQALFDAGAHFIGKTQTEEFAFSLTGHNSHYPRPINPAAPDRMAGGSSSGSIAAVAGGLADIATGSDTGGSVRAPASYCGLIGLRTTYEAISLEGTMPLSPSFDVFGWFARNMELYRKIAGLYLSDTGVTFQRIMRQPSQDALVAGPEEMRVYEKSVSVVEAVIGAARPVTINSADVEERYWCMRRIQAYEAWREHGAWISAADRQLGPGVKERFKFGSHVSAEALRADTILRDALRHELTDVLADDGLLISPTVPGAAPLASATFENVQDYRERALRMLCLSGLTGLPELTLPLGTVGGAPFGLSLTGPKGSDLALLAVGQKILEARDEQTPQSKL